MLKQIASEYLFIAGLVTGMLLYALVRQLAGVGLSDVLAAMGQVCAAPFKLIGRLFRSSGGSLQSRQTGSSVTQQEISNEEQIKASSQAIRNILMSLAVVIKRTDQAASNSNQALGDVRETIGKMGLPNDLADVHNLLMREIDHMIVGNTALKRELSRSQESLAVQKLQIEELRSAVRLDGLTQLANRAYLDERLQEKIGHRQRYNEIFSLLLIDVDHFKDVNDKYGHPAGDRILKGVAFNLKSAMRDSDFVARFGGDEFAIILFRSNGRSALEVSKKLCAVQQESAFVLDGVNIKVTLSIGVAEAGAEDTVESLLKRADQALYQVKSEGRNGAHLL